MKPPSVARGAAANVAGRIWLIALNLAIVPVYLRLLGVEAYGLVGVLVSFQAIMSIMDVGLGPTLARALARRAGVRDSQSAAQMRDWVKTVGTIVAATNGGFAAVVALASNWLALNWFRPRTLDLASVSTAIRLMGVVVAAQFFANLCASGIQALERQGLANLINSSAATLRALTTVVALLTAGQTVRVFFFAQAAITILHALTGFLSLRIVLPTGFHRARVNLALLRPEWRFALGSTGIAFVSLAVNHIDKLVVSRFFPLSEFGYYSIASSLANATPMLVTPIVQACYPRLCVLHAQQDVSALRRFYQLTSQWITVALAGPAATVVLFASEVLHAWTGNSDVAFRSSRIAIFLTLGYFFNGAMNAPYILNLAYGKTRLFFVSNTVFALLLVPTMVVLVPRFGASGAALGWLAYSAASLIVVAPLAHRGTISSETWRWPLRDVALPALAAFVGALMVRAIPWPGEGGTRLAAFVRVGLAFATATLAALFAARQAAASAVRVVTSRLFKSPTGRA